MPVTVGRPSSSEYDYNLLLGSRRTADRVTRPARAEAERTLATAEQQRAELEKRIEQLRGVERELTAMVAERLRTAEPTGADQQAGD